MTLDDVKLIHGNTKIEEIKLVDTIDEMMLVNHQKPNNSAEDLVSYVPDRFINVLGLHNTNLPNSKSPPAISALNFDFVLQIKL